MRFSAKSRLRPRTSQSAQANRDGTNDDHDDDDIDSERKL
jgi:hypothetical protein